MSWGGRPHAHLFEGVSYLSSLLLLASLAFISPRQAGWALVYDWRAPKSNMASLANFVVAYAVLFLLEFWVPVSGLALGIGLAALCAIPVLVQVFRPLEIQARIAAGEVVEEHGRQEKLYAPLEPPAAPSRFISRMEHYAIFGASDGVRLLIQFVVTFALAYGAIALSRQSTDTIATIWWANGYLGYCLLLHPRSTWWKPLSVFYVAVLLANALSQNDVMVSSMLTLINTFEGTVFALVATAIMGLELHGRRLLMKHVSVQRFAYSGVALLCITFVFSVIGGGALSYFFGGDLVENAYAWGSGDVMGAMIVAVLSVGKIIRFHLGYNDLQQWTRSHRWFGVLYIAAIAAFYAFAPVGSNVSIPHMVFIVVSLPLASFPSVLDAARLFAITSTLYFHFGVTRWTQDHFAFQFPFAITLVAFFVTLTILGRKLYARERDQEAKTLQFIPSAILTFDEDRKLLSISKNAEEWFDVPAEKLLGQRLYKLIDNPEEVLGVSERANVLQPDGSLVFPVKRTKKNGEYLELEAVVRTNEDLASEHRYIVSLRDVTREALLAEQARNLIDRSQSILIAQDRTWTTLQCSDAWCDFSGYSREETLAQDFNAFLHPDDVERGRHERTLILEGKGPANSEPYRLLTKAGDIRYVQLRTSERFEDGQAQIIMTLFDMTEVVQTETFNALLLDESPSIVLVQNDKWQIESCSREWSKVFGYGREETLGRSLLDFVSPDMQAFARAERTRVWNGEVVRHEGSIFRIETKSGEYREVKLVPRLFDLWGTKRTIVTLTDVTELVEVQEKLQFLVEKDELTEVFSRRGLAAQYADGNRTQDYCIALVDLDYFKSVNDNHGHEAGDKLLKAAAAALVHSCGTGGTVFRLGGEEFMVLFPWTNWGQAEQRVEFMRRTLAETSITVANRRISRTGSFGYGLLKAKSSLTDVMRLVDLAQREGKATGRNRSIAANPTLQKMLSERGAFVNSGQIEDALQKGEFYYAVQPIWNVETKSVEGFEALIRWRRPNGEIVPPEQFVDIFDEVTRAPKWAELVLNMRQSVLEGLSAYPDAYVSFNYKLEHLAFEGAACGIIEQYSAIKDHADRVIMIELSEKAFGTRGDREALQAELSKLRDKGFLVALDDFGVESSNLNRLKDFPIDVVKLDKALIDGLLDSTVARSMLRGLSLTIRNLNLKCIVEGVETVKQARMLMHYRLFSHQGYLHSYPMRPEELAQAQPNIGYHIEAQVTVEDVRRQMLLDQQAKLKRGERYGGK